MCFYRFTNNFPYIEISYEILDQDNLSGGNPITMQVTLEKEDEDEGDALAVAPFFPHKKLVNWWLVIGDPGTKNLLGIKRVTVAKTLSVKLEFTLPQVSSIFDQNPLKTGTDEGPVYLNRARTIACVCISSATAIKVLTGRRSCPPLKLPKETRAMRRKAMKKGTREERRKMGTRRWRIRL